MEPPPETSPFQLIVEGADDLYFFGTLQAKMYHHKLLTKLAFIREIGGKDSHRWQRVLRPLVDRSEPIEAIGLVRDADDDPQAAFQSLCGSLIAVGLPEPTEANLITDTGPRVGVLILPGPAHLGIREDLCLAAVADDPVMFCIDKYIECLHDRLDNEAFPAKNDSKAKLGAFLASRKQPEYRIGKAVEYDYIPWDSPAFADIREFLINLIG